MDSCLFIHHESMDSSGGRSPLILNLDASWRLLISFIFHMLYPWGKIAWYPLNVRDGPHWWSGCFCIMPSQKYMNRKILCLCHYIMFLLICISGSSCSGGHHIDWRSEICFWKLLLREWILFLPKPCMHFFSMACVPHVQSVSSLILSL